MKTLMMGLILMLLSSSIFQGVNVHASMPSQNPMADSIEVSEAWARATFALAKTGAAYVHLHNTSEQDIVLVSVAVDEALATMAELHETVMKNDMMKMQELRDGVVIKASQTLELSPGGKHIMLMGLNGPLTPAQQFKVNFTFADGSVKPVSFMVKDARSGKPMQMNH